MSRKQMSSALIPGGRNITERPYKNSSLKGRTDGAGGQSYNSVVRTLGNNKDADKIGVFAPSSGNNNKTQITTVYLFVPSDRNSNNCFLGKWKLSLPFLPWSPFSFLGKHINVNPGCCCR